MGFHVEVDTASSKNQGVLCLPAIEKDTDGRIPVTCVLNTQGKKCNYI